MENTTTNTTTFTWPGINQPVQEGQFYHLEYLGYEGPAPETFFEASTLIEELLRAQPDEPCNIIFEGDERNEDGFTAFEMEYARIMYPNKKKEEQE